MADFHHLDDARKIWLAVKARFGGNKESKKIRKTMLKQEFLEFSVSEEEGLHKGYDRFQKILSQLNQMQVKPDNDDVNIKFLRALHPSCSQVALTLKTRGDLVYLRCDDLYNKLRSFEIDVKGGSSYGSRSTTVAPTHSAFIGAASTNTKMVYSNQPSHSSLITYTSAHSGGSTGDGRIRHQMADGYALSKDQQVDEKARYSAFKISEVKTKEPKAMMAGFKLDFADHAGNAAGSVYNAAAEFAMMRISPKVRILSANLENTTNTLKYSETLYDQAKIEKKEWEVKFVESLARSDKWKESSKNLAKLKYSSMSTRTKLGLGFKEYIGLDEVCDLSTPSVFDHEPENREVISLYESKSHLIKDCDVYDTVDTFPSVISKVASVPAGSRNSSASTSVGRSIPASSRNRPASIHAGRHIPAGRFNKPAPFPAGRSVPTGWTNHAARPFFRPTNLYFDNVSWPGIYEHMSMNEGRWGSVVKSSAGYSWRYNRPYMKWRVQEQWWISSIYMVSYLMIHKAGLSHMTRNKEKLDDFVQVKGGTVTFGGEDGKITGKGTIRTSKLNFENVYYMEELQHFNLFYVSQIEAVSTACYVLNRVSITNPHNKTPYELLSGKVPNIRHLKPFRCQVIILNTSDHLGKFERKANEGFLVGYAANRLGQEWYFDLDYLTGSLGYTRVKTNTPAGTQDTNINAGTQDDDSESECDEQEILVPSFHSNTFSGPKVNDVSAPIENNLDYAEELARL
nr:ribonuclease H-like domain-containing protein [Tanacetum cinerariifolium]